MQLTQSNIFLRNGAGRVRDLAAASPNDGHWMLFCALAIVPFTAILHHAVFLPTTCMLNHFGEQYSAEVLMRWLAGDPSLLVGIACALAVYAVGLRFPALRGLLPPFLIAFLPLAVWVWDIPLTGRVICMNFHDERVQLLSGVPLKARHLYVLGAAAYCGLLLHGTRSARRPLPLPVPAVAPRREAERLAA